MLNNIDKIHFIGVGGYGMSALAKILVKKGYTVSGSDLSPSNRTQQLEELGAEITYNHERNNVDDQDLLIYSTAIPEDNPELMKAREEGMTIWHRSKLLAELLNEKQGIAVAGAHGKTTTTSMLSLILQEAGEDPTCVIGGEVSHFEGNARMGHGKYVVAEACESDHSFLRYRPYISIITNVEADHLEHYEGSFDQLLSTYREFIENIYDSGILVVNQETIDEMPDLVQGFESKLTTFGLNEKADLYCSEIIHRKGGSTFTVYSFDGHHFNVDLNVPGRHNILNALSAIAVALKLDISVQVIQFALSKFKGAKRRFTEMGRTDKVVFIDDYAHHPTEISETMTTARKQADNKVVAIFQPHRYTRTKYFLEEFASSFEEADLVILNSVFSAGEEEIPGANSLALGDLIKDLYPEKPVYVYDDMTDIENFVESILDKGDYVITMGAGNIWKVSQELAEKTM